jgi:hypothetical protein
METDKATISEINTKLYSEKRIFVLKLQKEISTWAKVIAHEPLFLQIVDDDANYDTPITWYNGKSFVVV